MFDHKHIWIDSQIERQIDLGLLIHYFQQVIIEIIRPKSCAMYSVRHLVFICTMRVCLNPAADHLGHIHHAPSAGSAMVLHLLLSLALAPLWWHELLKEYALNDRGFLLRCTKLEQFRL